MQLLEEYFRMQEAIYDYFGYVEDWVVIPLQDYTGYYWCLSGEGPGDEVRYHDFEANLQDEGMDYYQDSVYTQRFLPRWVYRGEDFTMVCVDTHVDGNKFLAVFSNIFERPWGQYDRTEYKKELAEKGYFLRVNFN